VRACVRDCVCVRVRARARACVCVCACACLDTPTHLTSTLLPTAPTPLQTASERHHQVSLSQVSPASHLVAVGKVGTGVLARVRHASREAAFVSFIERQGWGVGASPSRLLGTDRRQAVSWVVGSVHACSALRSTQPTYYFASTIYILPSPVSSDSAGKASKKSAFGGRFL
jgi:hypothetical protein